MKKRKDRRALRMLVLISQLGICMLTAIFLCVFLGRFLAQQFHQELFFPFMLLLGILAGMRSCYDVIRRFVDLESRAPYVIHKKEKDQKGKNGGETFGEKEESDGHEMDRMDGEDQ